MSDPTDAKLAQARQHVESGRRIISAQESLVDEIKAKGGDATDSQSMLDTFRNTQQHFEADLLRLAGRSQHNEA